MLRPGTAASLILLSFHMIMPGTLYVVATPLGNLGDLSPRAAETLRTVDTVAAEDTRRTKGLLSSIDAHPRLVSYHAHSDDRRAESLLDDPHRGPQCRAGHGRRHTGDQ